VDLVAVRILVLVFSVVFHECAHGWVAWKLGDDTAQRSGRLTLNPLPHLDLMGSVIVPVLLSFTGTIMFGWAKPVPVNPGRLRDPWNDYPKVAAAGPGSNLLLALVFAVLLGVTIGVAAAVGAGAALEDGPSPWKFLITMFQTGVMVNVVLAMFNLIPLPPLDGSWILSRFLPAGTRQHYEGLRRHGFLVVVGFLLLMRYTAFGPLMERGLMQVIKPYFDLAILVAGWTGA
jgi:Zn-dependent protease